MGGRMRHRGQKCYKSTFWIVFSCLSWEFTNNAVCQVQREGPLLSQYETRDYISLPHFLLLYMGTPVEVHRAHAFLVSFFLTDPGALAPVDPARPQGLPALGNCEEQTVFSPAVVSWPIGHLVPKQHQDLHFKSPSVHACPSWAMLKGESFSLSRGHSPVP